jgi:solute carrier family 12 sodium/potassium/chloride transporter 2
VLVGKVTKASLRERKAYPTHVKVTPKLIALSQTIINSTLQEGVSSLIQSTGLGKLSPNTIVIEFPEDWRTCSDQKLTV